MARNQQVRGINDAGATSLLRQGWSGLALWMALGLVLEGLMACKAPAYLADPVRRELFRLAHTHGTLLSVVLIGAALTAARHPFASRTIAPALRLGALLMPVGFLFAGIVHSESDPGPAIWLVPPGALLMLYGAVATAVGVARGSDAPAG